MNLLFFRYIFLLLVVPNIIFFVAKQFIYLYRPIVNIDYLVIGVFLSWLPVWAKAICLACVAIIDVLISVGPTFHFSVESVLSSLKSVGALDSGYVFLILLGALISISICAFIGAKFLSTTRNPRKKIYLSIMLCGLSFLIFQIDNLISLGKVDKYLPDTLRGINIATSPFGRIAATKYTALKAQKENTSTTPARMEGATKSLFHQIDSPDLPENIVLVIMESLGVPTDIDQREVLASYFSKEDIQKWYTVEHGVIESYGSTVPGELRELCERRVPTINIDKRQEWMPECLPNILKEKKYTTTAIHGFPGSFFERQLWYPWVGFDHLLFVRSLRQELKSDVLCGKLFPGTCDGAIVDWLSNKLDENNSSKHFYYWLTLNAHLPVAPPKTSKTGKSCERDDIYCLHMGMHHLVLKKLESLAIDVGSNSRTAFIIVGDHPPPFARLDMRNRFQPNTVPYWILSPVNPQDSMILN